MPAPVLDHDQLAAIAVVGLVAIIAGTTLVAIFCRNAKPPEESKLDPGAVDAIDTPEPAREPNLSTPVAVTRDDERHEIRLRENAERIARMQCGVAVEICAKCELDIEHTDCVFGPPPPRAA